jgi:hypothetical protein
MYSGVQPKNLKRNHRAGWFWAFIIIAALALILLGWWKWKKHNIQIALPAPTTTQAPLYAPQDKPMTIVLKGWNSQAARMVGYKATIRQSKSRYNQIKQAVLAYLQGPREGVVQVPVPEGMALNQFYLTVDGSAVVDLSLSGIDKESFGFFEETLFVRGLIESLSTNFFEVRQVKILVDGKDATTLGGHYALGTSEVNMRALPAAANAAPPAP